MDNLDHIKQLMEINAKLDHEYAKLREQLSLEEWCELLRRDMEAEQLRKQNMLQECIRHAGQIIAERKSDSSVLHRDESGQVYHYIEGQKVYIDNDGSP